MKNRKTLYVLLPLVIIIWGTIFWKIFWGPTEAAKKVSGDNHMVESVIKETREEERALVLDYRDPFSVDLTPMPRLEPQELDEPKRNVFNRVPMWPEITYFGLVKNSSKDNSVALLEINRSRHFTRVGDEFDEIKCFFINNDSIGLVFQNNQKYFMRNGIRSVDYY